MPGKRIVITTYGSLGDIHPYVPLALELKARGHRPVIATSELYREKIEALGLEFYPVRPDLPGPEQKEEMIELSRRAMDARRGTEYVIRELFTSKIREMYEDLSAATDGADLLVSHVITYAAPLVAARRKLRWVSTVLAPISFFSAYDPPVPPQLPVFVHAFRLLSRFPALARPLFNLGKRQIAPWAEPIDELRAELGLPRGANPFFEGQHSPTRVLAMFSRLLAAPQPDWPPQTRVTGFCFYDRRDPESPDAAAEALPPELTRFLEAGKPPVVFTLGSSAVWGPGNFYREAVAAITQLGERAVMLVGDTERNLPESLPGNILALDYAPYGELLPHASVVVHQGGVGTTAQALRAGKPALVVPFTHDQPDNAARVARLGCARVLPRKRYTAPRLAKELRELLDNPGYTSKAAEVGRYIRNEDGARNACDAIEEVMSDE